MPAEAASALVTEEAGLGVAHPEPQLPVDEAVVVEEEQPDVVEPGVPVDVDLVLESLAGRRQVALVDQPAAEQPVDALAAIDQVDAQVRDQHQVGLPGLDHDAARHVSVVQVPGVFLDVGLRPDDSGAHGEGLPVEAGDSIGEEQRGLGHAGLAFVLVLLGEVRPEDLGDRPRGVHLEVASVERDPTRPGAIDGRLAPVVRTASSQAWTVGGFDLFQPDRFQPDRLQPDRLQPDRARGSCREVALVQPRQAGDDLTMGLAQGSSTR